MNPFTVKPFRVNPFGRMANASRRAGPKEGDEGSGGSSGVRLPDADMADLSVAQGGMAVTGELRVEVMLASFADRKSTRLNSSHIQKSRMPSSA